MYSQDELYIATGGRGSYNVTEQVQDVAFAYEGASAHPGEQPFSLLTMTSLEPGSAHPRVTGQNCLLRTPLVVTKLQNGSTEAQSLNS